MNENSSRSPSAPAQSPEQHGADHDQNQRPESNSVWPHENIVHDPSARELFPQIEPVSYRVAVERALARLQASNIETTWSDALSSDRRENSG